MQRKGDFSQTLNQDGSLNAKGYTVRFGLERDRLASEVNVGNLTAYKMTTLTNNSIYYFSVVAGNDHGKGKASGVVSAMPTH